jgi:hypothetical protein
MLSSHEMQAGVSNRSMLVLQQTKLCALPHSFYLPSRYMLYHSHSTYDASQ